MEDLIKALEEAETGSSELGANVLYAVNRVEYQSLVHEIISCGMKPTPHVLFNQTNARNPTTSLDAITALIKEVMPEWFILWETTYFDNTNHAGEPKGGKSVWSTDGTYSAELINPLGGGAEGTGATGPLALCIALLKALEGGVTYPAPGSIRICKYT